MPSRGYRAVHVVVHVSGLPVEVQVRTPLQHEWAEYFERPADLWGRDIRYPEGVPDVGRALGAVSDATRAALTDDVAELARDHMEFAHRTAELIARIEVDEQRGSNDEQTADVRDEVRALVADLVADIDALVVELGELG